MSAGAGLPLPLFAGVLCAGAAAWGLAGCDRVSRRARLVLAGGGGHSCAGRRAGSCC
ncbi:hypothetical protein MRQ86_21370 [Streptomyces sp. MMS21 TC-5]|nr:hypothetical protein [Streptomyces sp. MMS21 TC-5]MCI4082824.1 hypothetical protein [Streptomyces sp. MMS21 TC-5]